MAIRLPVLASLALLAPSAGAALRLTVAAVDPATYHIVVVADGNPTPPASPFVVQTAEWPRAKRRADGAEVETPPAALRLGADGGFVLRDRAGRTLLAGAAAERDGAIALTLTHAADERLYGAGNLDRNRSGSLLHPSGTQIVGNGVTRVPYLWSTGGWSALVANDESGIAWNDDGGRLAWSVPGPYADLYLSVAPDGYGLLDALSRLTGRAPIPPRWSFGFLMSRWGYADAADVRDKWHGFRDRRIPVDAFIYDYDWFQDDWRFNPKTFPEGSLDAMHALGLRFVGIRKPRLEGENRRVAERQGWTLNSPQGVDLRFDLAPARAWWWSHQAPLARAGVDGWWNDEAEQTYDEFFHMAQAQWEGGPAVSPRRVWSLNRAFAPGIARFGAAAWTGDIDSRWDVLEDQPGTLLNWGLAGMAFVGQDLGGFIGQPSPELYARWIEQGVFQPIMRTHGMLNLPRWPWAFGDDVLSATKKAIELRYRLIPYLYTLAEETSRTGAPMMRPLFLEFPRDPRTFDRRDEWLLGSRLLAAPILTAGGTRDVYLPEGRWFDLATGRPVDSGTLGVRAALDEIPAYVRAGTILPLGPVVQSTSLPADGPIEVRVFPGVDAAFTLYEDACDDYGYRRGESSRIPMRWDERRRMLTIGARVGEYPGMAATRSFIVALPSGVRQEVAYSGRSVSVRLAPTP